MEHINEKNEQNTQNYLKNGTSSSNITLESKPLNTFKRKYALSKYTGDEIKQRKPNDTVLKSVLLELIRNSVIGQFEGFKGPFGPRRITYCDFTASGRALSFVENFIRNEVLPFYGNTHTTSSHTGKQTTLFREEARSLIKRLLNGQSSKGSPKDVLIFCGSGSTSAILKIVQVLGLHIPPPPNTERPVIFIGPFEHHSNILPWREAFVDVVEIKEDANGGIDKSYLEAQLKLYISRPLKIGSFSAVSNVTGIVADVNTITVLLHRYGALSFWDYASGGPYLKIDMNPVIEGQDSALLRKDAIFLSPHKMIGGVETPGILLAKKKLFKIGDFHKKSHQPGGGTVFFVTEKDHRYVSEIENREEGGTPQIVGSIRAGLVFHLKNIIGEETIAEKESFFYHEAFKALKENSNIVILGNTQVERLPIISFMIRYKETFLHYNFVSTLLNDLFGIQVRGGCACAGPYGQRLLGINFELAKEFERVLILEDDNEFLRPGFVRLSFNYFLDNETFQFILQSLLFIADHGWKFLPQYTFYPDTGEWIHQNQKKFPSRKWIGDVRFSDGQFQFPAEHIDTSSHTISSYLEEASSLSETIMKDLQKVNDMITFPHLNEENINVKWFLFPSEASAIARGKSISISPSPFHPHSMEESLIEKPSNGSISQVSKSNDEDHLLFSELNIEEEQKPISLSLFPSIPKKELLNPVRKALLDYDMIHPGDRILLGLSGGKDSLSLLHILIYLKKTLPIQFDLAACTIDPQTESYDPSPLKNYVKSLGVPYFFESQGIIETAKLVCPTSLCSWCARMKRGTLYNCARREGYNVLALGQHLDDLAESFLMSAFHNGKLRTMKANYLIDEGDIRVIRPLVYVREKDTRDFALSELLPVIAENCPACFETPKERHRIKTLLANQEHLFPELFSKLLATMKPLMEKKPPFEKDNGDSNSNVVPSQKEVKKKKGEKKNNQSKKEISLDAISDETLLKELERRGLLKKKD